MASGRCNCGVVAFEITADVSDVFVCHCSICRRATGSNGIAVVIVDNTALHWTSGEEDVRFWKKPDTHWELGFCGICGSPAPGKNDEERLFVPAGLLEAPTPSMSVVHHIYVDSRASWDEIGDKGQQHSAGFVADEKEPS